METFVPLSLTWAWPVDYPLRAPLNMVILDGFQMEEKVRIFGVLGIFVAIIGCKEAPVAAPANHKEIQSIGKKNAHLSSTNPKSDKSTNKKSFNLSVVSPQPGKVGDFFVATIKVLPADGYKVNLEYPINLKAKGSKAISPSEIDMRKKDAAKFSAKEALFQPKFKAETVGEHHFAGEFKFSVCTSKLCELKNEKIGWIITAH